MFSRLLIFFLIVQISLPSNIEAGLPRYIIKFDNVTHNRKALMPVIQDWEFYLKDHDEILYNKPDHKYKNDQFCRFSFDIDEQHNVNKKSIKLLEHKENYKYNLGALDFLQNMAFHFKKENESEPIIVDMRYYSY